MIRVTLFSYIFFANNKLLEQLLKKKKKKKKKEEGTKESLSHTNEIENFVHLFMSKTKQANSPFREGFDDSIRREVYILYSFFISF